MLYIIYYSTLIKQFPLVHSDPAQYTNVRTRVELVPHLHEAGGTKTSSQTLSEACPYRPPQRGYLQTRLLARALRPTKGKRWFGNGEGGVAYYN